MASASLEMGAQIASQAKVLAPVDLGQLRNGISASSISQTVLLNNKSGDKAEALDTTGIKDNEVYVGANVKHAIFQEYGTVKQAAQPFLRPAAELVTKSSNVDEIVKKYSRKAMKQDLKDRTVKTYG